jgi:hypothetical protein
MRYRGPHSDLIRRSLAFLLLAWLLIAPDFLRTLILINVSSNGLSPPSPVAAATNSALDKQKTRI